jgi:hypothetical protein
MLSCCHVVIAAAFLLLERYELTIFIHSPLHVSMPSYLYMHQPLVCVHVSLLQILIIFDMVVEYTIRYTSTIVTVFRLGKVNVTWHQGKHNAANVAGQAFFILDLSTFQTAEPSIPFKFYQPGSRLCRLSKMPTNFLTCQSGPSLLG